jgi:hypothetical protein
MRVKVHISCQIQHTSAGLRYVNSVRCQIQQYISSAYTVIYIQLKISPLLIVIRLQLDARYNPHFLPNTAQIGRFALRELLALHMQRICSLADSALNIQLKVSRFLLQVCRQLDSRSTPQLMPDTAHISRFSPCQLRTLSNSL